MARSICVYITLVLMSSPAWAAGDPAPSDKGLTQSLRERIENDRARLAVGREVTARTDQGILIRGTIRELNEDRSAARLELEDGSTRWVLAEDLVEPVESVEPRSTHGGYFGALGVTGSLPAELVGGTGLLAGERRVGLYVDFKTTPATPLGRADYYPTMSIETAEVQLDDELNDTLQTWNRVTLGPTYGVLSWLGVYGGVGLSFPSRYREYLDETGLLADDGTYWIDGPAQRARVNGSVGVYARPARFVAVHMGMDLNPASVSAGVCFAFDVSNGAPAWLGPGR